MPLEVAGPPSLEEMVRGLLLKALSNLLSLCKWACFEKWVGLGEVQRQNYFMTVLFRLSLPIPLAA